MITTSIDDRAAKAELKALASGGAIARAWRRATRKTADWVVGQLARRMSAATGIPQRVFRVRRIKQRATQDGRLVWFGSLPVPAGYVGRLRQLEPGAMAGAYYFEGAFVAKMPSGHAGIFKRRGQARLPIVEQAVRLPTAEQEAQAVAAEAGAVLLAKTRQELNYELNVRGAR